METPTLPTFTLPKGAASSDEGAEAVGVERDRAADFDAAYAQADEAAASDQPAQREEGQREQARPEEASTSPAQTGAAPDAEEAAADIARDWPVSDENAVVADEEEEAGDGALDLDVGLDLDLAAAPSSAVAADPSGDEGAPEQRRGGLSIIASALEAAAQEGEGGVPVDAPAAASEAPAPEAAPQGAQLDGAPDDASTLAALTQAPRAEEIGAAADAPGSAGAGTEATGAVAADAVAVDAAAAVAARAAPTEPAEIVEILDPRTPRSDRAVEAAATDARLAAEDDLDALAETQSAADDASAEGDAEAGVDLEGVRRPEDDAAEDDASEREADETVETSAPRAAGAPETTATASAETRYTPAFAGAASNGFLTAAAAFRSEPIFGGEPRVDVTFGAGGAVALSNAAPTPTALASAALFGAAAPETARAAANQISAALVQSAGQTRIEVALNPPELGRVSLELSFDEAGRVSVLMQADRDQTLDLLKRHGEELARALKEAGLSLEDMTFAERGDDARFADDAEERRRNLAGFGFGGAAEVIAPPPAARGAMLDGRLDLRV